MNKYLYLLRETTPGPAAAFKSRILDEWMPALRSLNPAGLKLSLTDAPRPRLTVLPLRKDNLALISVWSDSAAFTDQLLAAVNTEGLILQGYQVEESVPVAYDKSWPDGTPSPGVVLLTLLKQNPKLSYQEFMHEWHGRHTPKAMRIHPFWNYIRNVIQAPVVQGSPAFEGIVEEHFRTRQDCVNPVRMFGGPLKFIPHMIEVGLHAQHFLDLKSTENYLLTETHFISRQP